MNRKKIWITGASSGIGRALALEFAKEGAQLVLSGRNLVVMQEVAKEVEHLGGKAELLAFDVKEIDRMPELCKQAWSFFNGLDVLVNNAGFSQRALIMESSIEIDRELMEVDYFSKVALTKALLPYFVKQGSGHVVVISSIAGKFGFPYRSAYSAAKHALLGFFETLRLELKDIPIYVTNVCPGRIKTNISVNAITSTGERHGKMDYGQDNGMDAAICAQKIVHAMHRRRKEVYIGGKEILMVYFKRYIPSLFYFLASKVKPN